jgi:hypothetical protein
MRKDLIFGLIFIGCFVLSIIIYLVIRHESYKDSYQEDVGALRPSYPGEYDIIGGRPGGLGWV